MRVADYISEFLSSKGIEHVFLVTGGGAMHLNDAFGRNKKMKFVPFHHEQACAIAAEAYYRTTGQMAAVNVTTGPGGTNAITGVFGAYVDSLAMFVVSGQVKWETLVRSTDLPLRQLGDQEVDIVRMVSGITKYAVVVEKPEDIRYHLEKAYYLANTGRPGPVWLDVPINIQAMQVDEKSLKGFTPEANDRPSGMVSLEQLSQLCDQFLKDLSLAQRPVIMVGAGIRISESEKSFLEFAERLGVPVATCWNAHDVIWDEHPLYVGRPGTIGNRAGNFAVQNADLVLVLGSRLNIRQISYNWQSFAKNAKRYMLDIDSAELKKPTLKIDVPICADLRDFFKVMGTKLETYAKVKSHSDYVSWCKERLAKYPVLLDEYKKTEQVNPYCFVDELFANLKKGDVVVTGDGTACVSTFQGAILKEGQRLFTNSGCASMGYDVPAAIGASLALDNAEVVCIAGDGSIMMNLQELQTIVNLKLPIKLFILNNFGYHSIRQTQQNFFADNVVGCGVDSGLSFPDFGKIAAAFGIPYSKVSGNSDLSKTMQSVLNASGAQICEVVLDLKQQFSPKLSSRKLEDGSMVTSPLEDMAPFLSRDELASNLIKG